MKIFSMKSEAAQRDTDERNATQRLQTVIIQMPLLYLMCTKLLYFRFSIQKILKNMLLL